MHLASVLHADAAHLTDLAWGRLQAALELSLLLKQREAGLRYLSFWGKILTQSGKASMDSVCASQQATLSTALCKAAKPCCTPHPYPLKAASVLCSLPESCFLRWVSWSKYTEVSVTGACA